MYSKGWLCVVSCNLDGDPFLAADESIALKEPIDKVVTAVLMRNMFRVKIMYRFGWLQKVIQEAPKDTIGLRSFSTDFFKLDNNHQYRGNQWHINFWLCFLSSYI